MIWEAMAGGIRGRRDPDMSRCAADVMRVFPEVRTDGLRAGVSTGFSTASTQNGASSPAGACDSPASTASIRPAGGRPRNSTRVATTSVCWRLPPLFFASYSRVRRRPSTKHLPPLLEMFGADFAEAGKGHNRVPFNPFLLVAVLVGEGYVGSDFTTPTPLPLRVGVQKV